MFLNSAPAKAPEYVQVDVLDAHSMNIFWDPPTSHQNGIIRSYTVNISMNYREELSHQHSSNTTSILITDLIAYSTYFVQVAAVTVAEGPYSDSVYAATPEAGMLACMHNHTQ